MSQLNKNFLRKNRNSNLLNNEKASTKNKKIKLN